MNRLFSLFITVFLISSSANAQPISIFSSLVGEWNNIQNGDNITVKVTGDVLSTAGPSARVGDATDAGGNFAFSGLSNQGIRYTCVYYITFLENGQSNWKVKSKYGDANCPSGLFVKVGRQQNGSNIDENYDQATVLFDFGGLFVDNTQFGNVRANSSNIELSIDGNYETTLNLGERSENVRVELPRGGHVITFSADITSVYGVQIKDTCSKRIDVYKYTILKPLIKLVHLDDVRGRIADCHISLT